jgi:hypothetical protein
MALIKNFEVDSASGTISISAEIGETKYTILASTADEVSATSLVNEAASFAYSQMYFGAGEFHQLPTKPSQYHAWNWGTFVWDDTRTLDQIKAAQWATIKAAREVDMTAPLTTPYGAFDATTEAQKSITDAVLMLQTLTAMGAPTSIDFTLADNSVVTLTTEQMVTVGLLLGQRTQQLYAQGRIKRDAINAATTAAEVEAVVW